ncbi:tetratricopeptide repeat protein [Psychroserpens sp. SPM9]|uniref:tetratricopeptide repeat protein n=1 Tax=Psychroserpens sp. SPM9 TaxID=2975598 RepID=UPI0021A3D2DF|nr:tetratricopeptide repeat protein [Psychroserpens sp. SPM9]MDG5492331.1 tetratricopeptide repeat protein [Psychroserpens sp. SPM9]
MKTKITGFKPLRQRLFTGIIFTLISVYGVNAQTYKTAFRTDMCACLEEESLKRKLTENAFKMCFNQVLPTYATLIDAEIIEADPNKKFYLGQLARKNLILSLQYELVYTCEVYYENLDRDRTSGKLIAREQVRESDLEVRNQYVAMSPNALAYFMRAQLHFNLGNLKEAEADIHKSLELNPNRDNAKTTRHELLLLAWIYEEYERYSEAVAIYDKITLGEFDTKVGILRALADKKAGGTFDNIPDYSQLNSSQTDLKTKTRRTTTSRNTTKKAQQKASNKSEKRQTKSNTDTTSLKKLFKIDN